MKHRHMFLTPLQPALTRDQRQQSWLQEIGESIGITRGYHWVMASVLGAIAAYIIIALIIPAVGYVAIAMKASH